jgi:hypothetical protein
VRMSLNVAGCRPGCRHNCRQSSLGAIKYLAKVRRLLA